MFIRFKNGSTWQLVGSDRYNSLVGAGVAGVTFSEFALANPSAWGYIRPMVEENNGWAAFISTPRGRNHFKSLLDMAKGNPKWFAEVLSVHDTGALTPEQLEESQAEYIALYGEDLGRAQFEQEYECSFNAAILGAFYAREMVAVRKEGRVQDRAAA
jgi:phage terminase large subunit